MNDQHFHIDVYAIAPTLRPLNVIHSLSMKAVACWDVKCHFTQFWPAVLLNATNDSYG